MKTQREKSIRNKNALIVFAKPPIAGFAKTRLISALGEVGAAEFHAKLLDHTLQHVVSKSLWDTYLWCAQEPNHPFFQRCFSRYDIHLQAQTQGDLGQRMTHAMQSMLYEYEKVCIVGADCPLMNAEKIKQAFADLHSQNDVVVTPAEDGGYVLMAVMLQLNPAVFSGVRWGGESVFRQILKNLRHLKLTPIIQSTLWDIDTPEDLHRVLLHG